jgi:hypothetical protein
MVSDTSWQRLTPARAKDIPSFHGEILAETTEDRLDLSQFQMLAATSDNEAYNALVCNEFAPEIGRDSVYQLGSAAGDDPRSLPEKLRGRALFATGLGVEELAAREAAGWTFLSVEVGEATALDDLKAALPDDADLLLLIRKGGALRFFTHASRPAPEQGDIVIVYAPASAASEVGVPADASLFASEVTK